MRLAETVTFGGGGMDRAAHLRRSPPEGPALPVWRGKPLLDAESRAPVLVARDHPIFAAADDPALFLGLSDGRAVYARDLSAWEPGEVAGTVGAFADPSEQVHPEAPGGAIFGELRANMARLSARDAEIAATAKAILGWHETHGHCARCGAATRMAQAGWQRDCPACGAHHFPRVDPVVIMLITHNNSLLVGRSPGWPEGMYSLLAGFVEPGETIEAAVRREVLEEAGIAVGEVDYLASQPWPFPSSLMFGCRGVALGTDIAVDPDELQDARWVTREEMVEVFAGRHPVMRRPRQGAIAGFLIENWLADRLD